MHGSIPYLGQGIITIVGSITVQLNSCLTGLDLTKQVKLLFIQPKQSSRMQEISRTVFSAQVYVCLLRQSGC